MTRPKRISADMHPPAPTDAATISR
jgi:hypothetical protein